MTEFPPSIAELSSRLRKRLKDLDHEIEQAEQRFQRIAQRLRGTGSPLGIDVDRSWHELTDPVRREIATLLRRLEKIVDPQVMPKSRRSAKSARKAKAKAA